MVRSFFFNFVAVVVLVLAVPIAAASIAQNEQIAGGGYPALHLHNAAGAGNLALVVRLLRENVDPNAVDRWLNKTPLHFAVGAPVSVDAIIAMLALAGANLNHQDITGRTPLHIAVTQGNDMAARALIKMGADVNTESRIGTTPLIDAIYAGNNELVGELIAAGADVNAADGELKTPLHYAAAKGNTDLIARLLSANAFVNAQDRSGNMPLDLIDPSDYEAIQLLISRGARTRLSRAMRGRPHIY